MFLYNLTLQRATGISHAIHGNFSGYYQSPFKRSVITESLLATHITFFSFKTFCSYVHMLYFLGTKQQEIVVSRGKILELLRPDANTGKVHTLLTMEVFGIIRSLMAFRLTGGTKGVCLLWHFEVHNNPSQFNSETYFVYPGYVMSEWRSLFITHVAGCLCVVSTDVNKYSMLSEQTT